MSDNMSIDESPESDEVAPRAPTPPKRGPGHRGQDVRDTMAEMAAKAHEISLEAGSKMAGAMRDVIGAAAGLTAFAIESARDLVQYMVRRGQMTQDEADKLMREVESAHGIIPKQLPKIEPARAEAARKSAPSLMAGLMAPVVAPATDSHKSATKKPAPSKPTPAKGVNAIKAAPSKKTAVAKAPAKAAAKAPAKKAAKAAAKKVVAKKK